MLYGNQCQSVLQFYFQNIFMLSGKKNKIGIEIRELIKGQLCKMSMTF